MVEIAVTIARRAAGGQSAQAAQAQQVVFDVQPEAVVAAAHRAEDLREDDQRTGNFAYVPPTAIFRQPVDEAARQQRQELIQLAEGVGLRSTSTVADYLDRMTRDGLITSIPSTPRSIRVVEQNLTEDACEDGSSLVCCKFKFPEGTYPMSVIAMVADGDQKNMVLVQAKKVEILRTSAKRTESAR